MNITRHGLMIGIERSNAALYIRLTVTGKLTHADYEIITPMLEAALAGIQEPRLNILVDARELEGWDAHGAWDDFKLGVKHRREFAKIAIVGNKRWQEMATRLAGWFIGGESKFFEDYDRAEQWLNNE